MDLLSDILKDAQWTNHLLVKKTLQGSWGFRFPCERSGGFHVIMRGSCYLSYEGRSVRLEKGDIVFVMRGVHHDLMSSPGEKVVDISRFQASRPAKTGPVCEILSVRYEFPSGEAHPFFRELPSIVRVSSSEISLHHPLHSVLALLSQESPGEDASSLILQRLTDILLYYALRQWLSENPPKAMGYRSAMKDHQIAAALDAVHRRPAHSWTLHGLSRTAGISRAAFASRFRAAMGVTPMDYITRLRLETTKDLLKDKSRTLEEIAREAGYSSAFAYSRAYKRVYGRSPRAA